MTTAWDAELYAANTAHHRRHDDEFLGDLALPAGARVLDVGCGVGDLTARLAALGPDVDVLGVDADPGMVAGAAARFGSDRLRFAVGRAQALAGIVPAGSVDAVFSMAALHWVPEAEHPAMLAQVRRVLRPGGLFRAQFGGRGQIAAVRSLLDAGSARLGGGPAGWFFPAAEQYAELLGAAGFAVPEAAGPAGWVRLVRQRRGFPTAGELVGWLRSRRSRRTTRCCRTGPGRRSGPPPRTGRWPGCGAPTGPTISISSGWTSWFAPPEPRSPVP